MNHVFLQFFVISQVLISKGHPQEEDYESEDYLIPEAALANVCTLPENLGFSGLGKPLVDCETLDRLAEPPCSIYSWGGNHPIVCCPTLENLDYVEVEEKQEYYDGYEYQYEHIYECDNVLPPIQCPEDKSCVSRSKCGKKDFNSTIPPKYCGFDKSGDDKLCCSDLNGIPTVAVPQNPKYPISNPKLLDCVDHTPECSRWAKTHPDSCSPGHDSYEFMRSACQKSCRRCGSDGCVDNYEKCADWTLIGQCSKSPQFMSFHCRESCGTCGFRSSFNDDIQVVNGKQYSDKTKSKFTCGEHKRKDKIKNSGENNVTHSAAGPTCTSVVINDRFVLTSARCVEGELSKGQTRTIGIREGTDYRELIEVRRFWRFPLYNRTAYYDIAVMELERRIIYDYDTIGDSPTCLGDSDNLDGKKAVLQGYGINEKGEFPGKLLETFVEIISNKDCQKSINWRLESKFFPKRGKIYVMESLPNGLNNHMLCTQGILDTGSGFYSGPCKGDEGGPLYINGKSNNEGDLEGQTLVAIHSGSAGLCGKQNFPAWWTRVSSYYDWILCVTRKASQNHFHGKVQNQCKEFVPKKFQDQLSIIDPFAFDNKVSNSLRRQ